MDSVTTSAASSAIYMTDERQQDQQPTTFRQAEVLGLKLMQERKYEQALQVFEKGMKLPGSKNDVIRKSVANQSPVGGSMGGFESKSSSTLDEFELQAAHYNMACAYAQLSNVDQALNSLAKSFESGFDNFGTVRADPDLDPVKSNPGYEALLERYEPKSKGFNPFGLFGK